MFERSSRGISLSDTQELNWKVVLILAGICGIPLIFMGIGFSLISLFDISEWNIGMGNLLIWSAIFAYLVAWAIGIVIGLWFGKKVGLGAPLIESWVNGEPVRERLISILKFSIGAGICVTVAKITADLLLFSSSLPLLLYQWQPIFLPLRLKIPFDQGLGDEIVFHLFWMTILVWIIYKIQKPANNQPTPIGVWIPIVIVSLLAVLKSVIHASSLLAGAQVLVIVSIGMIPFGWLYWKKGIESAMIAHFTSTLLLVLLTLM